MTSTVAGLFYFGETMPIRPENKARYPKDWKDIRKAILERAQNKCEGCGVANRTFKDKELPLNILDDEGNPTGEKVIKRVEIVLTIAHLDHTPENCDFNNLRAWCQKCHNSYDAPMRALNRRKNRESASAKNPA